MGCPQTFHLEVAADPGGIVVFRVPNGVLISSLEIRPRVPEREDASGNRTLVVQWSARDPGASLHAGGQAVREIRFGELPSGFTEEAAAFPLVPGRYYEAWVNSTNRGTGHVVFRIVNIGGSLRVEEAFGRWAFTSPRMPDGLVSAALLADARDRGDAEAQYQVGLAYLDGDGVWRDAREAYAWFLKAGRQGHARAQDQVARLGVYEFAGMSREEAFEWSMKSAVQGWPPAQVEVGLAYELGIGVTRDDKAAVMWLRKAAEAGNLRAMDYLGGSPER